VGRYWVPAFTLNGDDLFVQGQIGSIDGLFSATGVTVGAGATVYGDGNLYKTNSGDFTFALGNATNSFRFHNGGHGAISHRRFFWKYRDRRHDAAQLRWM
jgi:hypothetical protein